MVSERALYLERREVVVSRRRRARARPYFAAPWRRISARAGMQTFDVSANLLNDRLVLGAGLGAARAKQRTTPVEEQVDGAAGQAGAPGQLGGLPRWPLAGRALGEFSCVRSRFRDTLLLVLLQLACGVLCSVLYSVQQRTGPRLLLAAGLLLTPLAAVYLALAPPSLGLLWLLLAHDALVVAAIAA
jgi:hypothetical protein